MKKILITLCMVCSHLLSLQAQDVLLVNVNASSATSLPLIESEVFHLINKHRVANLLQPVRWASTPAHLARKHSLDMAKGLVPFGHQGSGLRYEEIRRKIPSATRFGENVAYNFGYSNPAEVAVNGWLKSPGHYANIMGDYNLAGVGVAKNLQGQYYFTQIFVKANVTLLSSLEGNDERLYSEEQIVCDNPIELEND